MSLAERVVGARMNPERPSQGAFFSVAALLFIASAAVTAVWGLAMSSMGELPMPGGWTMSTAWMPMCGQTWLGVAMSFLGMWIVMMVAMMLPSLTPMLWRYHQVVGGTGGSRPGWLTALVGTGYFSIWALFGMAVFPLGATLAEVLMRLPTLAHAAPATAGVVVVIAGAFQFTAWKAHHLACCRDAPGPVAAVSADAGTALRHGLRVGLHCFYACAGQTAILFALGVMDLRAMVLVAAAIAVERLAPAGRRAAQVTGAISIGTGLFLIGRAAGLA